MAEKYPALCTETVLEVIITVATFRSTIGILLTRVWMLFAMMSFWCARRMNQLVEHTMRVRRTQKRQATIDCTARKANACQNMSERDHAAGRANSRENAGHSSCALRYRNNDQALSYDENKLSSRKKKGHPKWQIQQSRLACLDDDHRSNAFSSSLFRLGTICRK
jgi:hypothetical protein